jgi:predicted acylesterase/phospholipase RssA/outer membrane translocation and assembly module TamA
MYFIDMRHCNHTIKDIIRFGAVALLIALLGNSSWAGTPPRCALVLSGGGARGMAQIGVLKAFEEAGIKPDLIVGTSMGAIIGSLYAAGYCADSIKAIFMNTAWDAFFQNNAKRQTLFVSQKAEPLNYLFEIRFGADFKPMVPQSLAFGQSFYDLLGVRLTGPLYDAGLDFDSLPIPLRIVATDIVSGSSVVFAHGNLATAVRASCGIPLAFAPVSIDSMLLMDGGLLTNIPVEQARNTNAQFIVAVDVTSPMWERGDLNNPVRLVNQILAIGMEKRKAAERLLADIVIQPDLLGFRNTDFSMIDTVIQRGYTAARRSIDQIIGKLDSLTTASAAGSIPLGATDSITAPIRWEGTIYVDEAIRKKVDDYLFENQGVRISPKTFDRKLAEFFNQSGLDYVHTDLVTNEFGGTSVTIKPGVVQQILVRGNTRTSQRLILTASNLFVGEVLTRQLIARTAISLYATNLFNAVNIEVNPDDTVVIVVEEKEYLRARLGIRFDEYHLGEVFLQPAYENLFGSGICLSLHLQYGLKREKYAFELAGSPLFSADWANNIRFQGYIARERISKDSIVYRESTYFDTLSHDSALQKDTLYEHDEMTLRKAGVLAMVGTQIGRSAMIDGGVRFERFKVSRSDVGAFEDPIGPTFRQGIRYLMVRLMVDDLDRFPFPTKGQKHYISIGGASDVIGGTESFVKVQGKLGYYFTIGKRHTLSPQLQFVWTNKSLQGVEVERVYLGGAMPEEKYRDIGVYNYIPFMGLRPRALSGDILFVIHAAYRFQIIKNLYSVFTLDWGKVWDKPEFILSQSSIRDFYDSAPLGLGMGLALKTPIGPISATWSRVIRGSGNEPFGFYKENVFYLSLGYDF